MRTEDLGIVLFTCGLMVGLLLGIYFANDFWRERLIEKNVAEWQVDKSGQSHFIIKPIKGEPL
jgi:hypothetical protein